MLLFSRYIVSDSLPHHELQHNRLPCPSLFPWVCSNSCPLSQWCHPTILSSVAPFSSCPPSFPASRSFPVNWLFTWSGQTIGALASASVLPVNIQGWLVWSPYSPRDSQESSPAPQFKTSILQHSAFVMVQLSLPYMTIRKIIALTTWTFVSKVMSLLFNMLCRFVIAFLPKSKHLYVLMNLWVDECQSPHWSCKLMGTDVAALFIYICFPAPYSMCHIQQILLVEWMCVLMTIWPSYGQQLNLCLPTV